MAVDEIEDWDDDYDPSYEEDQRILRERRMAKTHVLSIDRNFMDDFLLLEGEFREGLVKNLLNENKDVLAIFADHFLPSDDARYTLDEDPEVISIELDWLQGSAWIQGTCSMYSPCSDLEDLGREIDGSIFVSIDAEALKLTLSVDVVEMRNTKFEF